MNNPSSRSKYQRIFLLSPARCDGERAGMLLREGAQFELAQKLRSQTGAPLGELFQFMSGLYFRGKLLYANTFAKAPRGIPGTFVITSGRGILPANTAITVSELIAMSKVSI